MRPDDTLPAAQPGMKITFVNRTGVSMCVAPAPGEVIDGLAQVALGPNAAFIFRCATAGSWKTMRAEELAGEVREFAEVSPTLPTPFQDTRRLGIAAKFRAGRSEQERVA
jgi:hypothetical protein